MVHREHFSSLKNSFRAKQNVEVTMGFVKIGMFNYHESKLLHALDEKCPAF